MIPTLHCRGYSLALMGKGCPDTVPRWLARTVGLTPVKRIGRLTEPPLQGLTSMCIKPRTGSLATRRLGRSGVNAPTVVGVRRIPEA